LDRQEPPLLQQHYHGHISQHSEKCAGGGVLQRLPTPKPSVSNPKGVLKPDGPGQVTYATAAKFASLMKRIATLEKELQK